MQKMKSSCKKKRCVNWAEVFIAVIILVILLNFWNTRYVQPLRIFAVFNHEVSHGLAAMATGGSIVRIGLASDAESEGGFAETEGGNKFFIYNAGYLGSIIFGGILLWLSKKEKLARAVLFLIAMYLMFISVWFITTLDGMIYGVIFAFGLLLIAAIAGKFMSLLSLKILALSNCFLALIDVIVDFGGGGENDAVQLQQLTMVPAVFWWVIWVMISSFIVYKFFIISIKVEED